MENRSTKKVLIDNLGRVVGLIAPRTGKIGVNIEYGGVRDGVLDVRGIARIASKKMDDYAIEQLRTYDGNTGRMINSDAAAALGRIGGSAKTEAKQASSRENGKLGGRPTDKWTKVRIKRALEIIDTQDKHHVTATTEKSQRISDADFLRTYRKNLEFETQEDFREYVEMSRTREIDFLFNRLNKK